MLSGSVSKLAGAAAGDPRERGATRSRKRARADALPRAGCATQYPMRPAIAVRVQPESDPAHDLARRRRSRAPRSSDRTSPRMNASTSASGVRDGNGRDPARDLRVVAAVDERRDVLLGPRPQHEVAVAELHAMQCRNRSTRHGRECTALRPAKPDCPAGAQARPIVLREEAPRERVSDCEKGGRRPTLPGACAPSTIGAGGLNFSVRNGKRCIPAAMTAQIVEAHDLRVDPQNPSKLHSSFRHVQNQDLGQLVRLR